MEAEEPEREAEREIGDMEADVHVDKPKYAARRTWDAAKQAAAHDAACSSSSISNSRKESLKRQDEAVAAAAVAASAEAEASKEEEPAETPPIMDVPEHLLGKIAVFLDTYTVAK